MPLPGMAAESSLLVFAFITFGSSFAFCSGLPLFPNFKGFPQKFRKTEQQTKKG